MNPNMVAQARTARLVREARTPAYTTVTKPVVRQHLKVIELESDMGGRFWTKPMREDEVGPYLDRTPDSYGLSDIDCSSKCWCVKEGLY